MKNLEQILSNSDSSFIYRGVDDSNIKYLSGISLEDPFYVIRQEDETTILTRRVNKEKVQRKTSNDSVIAYEEYIDKGIRDDPRSEAQVLSELLKDKQIQSLILPPAFPVYVADSLREDEFDISILDYDAIVQSRMIKNDEEIEYMRSIQSLTEETMMQVKKMLEKSDVNEDNELVLENEVLTSGRIKQHVTSFLNEHGAEPTEGTIVASGLQTSGVHNFGDGPIKADQPIICDIFPRGENGYYGDMTRTFIKGEPTDEFKNMYRSTEEALQSALNTIEAGVLGSEVYEAASKKIQEYGYDTHTEADDGFIHSLGHGIGTEVHEKPSLNKECGVLEKNTILTVEPGVYLDKEGGVRIEDMVRVTEDGYENLNSMDNKILFV